MKLLAVSRVAIAQSVASDQRALVSVHRLKPVVVVVETARAAYHQGRGVRAPIACSGSVTFLLQERSRAPFRDLADLQQRLQLPAELVEGLIGRVSFGQGPIGPELPRPPRPPASR